MGSWSKAQSETPIQHRAHGTKPGVRQDPHPMSLASQRGDLLFRGDNEREKGIRIPSEPSVKVRPCSYVRVEEEAYEEVEEEAPKDEARSK
ncbi:hypothetical protein HAX54_007547 [Datura stramonium]|uniref:Uncharacterized protein n=1 Tax=Datura stramonium TaxID=4076 RepID=A0ABS8TDJ7_DATST|nr:hypothetical protein [Datura stramonium]